MKKMKQKKEKIREKNALEEERINLFRDEDEYSEMENAETEYEKEQMGE